MLEFGAFWNSLSRGSQEQQADFLKDWFEDRDPHATHFLHNGCLTAHGWHSVQLLEFHPYYGSVEARFAA